MPIRPRIPPHVPTPRCHQINLQRGFLGGEVYTVFLTRALTALGCPVTLYVSSFNSRWDGIALPGVDLVKISGPEYLGAVLPRKRSWILTNGPVPAEEIRRIGLSHLLTGFCHMPMYERDVSAFAPYHIVFPVSDYVRRSLIGGGLSNVYQEPFWGVAEFDRDTRAPAGPVSSHSPYSWDRRKLRDVLLGALEPAYRALLPQRAFFRRPGTTLGIVSGIGPIKQFPLLFSHIAPRIAHNPGIVVEIFGFGGYAQVRELERSLAPLRNRVRFWGRQEHPERIYPQLDYVLSGLPDKEALGLNIIESQVCGTPVLAVRAPPFTETVADRRSGYLYRDPREDAGADFARVLEMAIAAPRLDPRAAADHLARFSFDAYKERVARMLQAVSARPL